MVKEHLFGLMRENTLEPMSTDRKKAMESFISQMVKVVIKVNGKVVNSMGKAYISIKMGTDKKLSMRMV